MIELLTATLAGGITLLGWLTWVYRRRRVEAVELVGARARSRALIESVRWPAAAEPATRRGEMTYWTSSDLHL